jgi:hypothetical protein
VSLAVAVCRLMLDRGHVTFTPRPGEQKVQPCTGFIACKPWNGSTSTRSAVLAANVAWPHAQRKSSTTKAVLRPPHAPQFWRLMTAPRFWRPTQCTTLLALVLNQHECRLMPVSEQVCHRTSLWRARRHGAGAAGDRAPLALHSCGAPHRGAEAVARAQARGFTSSRRGRRRGAGARW